MTHSQRTFVVLAAVCTVPSVALALGADHQGAVGAAHASKWPTGLKELADRSDRVHGFWVNWVDVFFYSGDTAAFNDFLRSYSKLEDTVLEIVLHPGPKKARSPWDKANRDIPVDWSLYASPHLKEPKPSPGKFITRIDLYVGRNVGLEGLEVPTNVKVQSEGEMERFAARHQEKCAAQEKK